MTCPNPFAVRLRVVPVAATIAMAAGCGKPFNEQIDLVGTTPLPALRPAAAGTELGGEPSLSRGLDRQGWALVTVQVPTHQVAHYPTYVDNFRWEKQRGPWNPAYPTTESSIVDPTDAGADAADAITEPIYRALLLVWSPIDALLGNWPWNMHRSPSEPYVLVPDAPTSETLTWFDAAGDKWYTAPPPDGVGEGEGDRDAMGP